MSLSNNKTPFGTPLGMILLLLVMTFVWWLLAFLPVTTPDENWLKTLQAVCFGMQDNGLPSISGWIILILGPLSLVAALLIGWGTDLRRAWEGNHRALKIAIALMGLALVAEGIWVGSKIIRATKTLPAAVQGLAEDYPRTDRPAPELKLLDQHGKETRLAGFQGKTVLLTFAFAHCQAICPTIVNNVQRALEQTDPRPPLLIVTLDPWRDTPQSLPTLAEGWKLSGEDRVLSGNVDEVLQVLKSYDMPISRNEQNGDVAHPGLVYIIDAEGRIAYTLNNPSAQAIKDAIQRTAR